MSIGEETVKRAAKDQAEFEAQKANPSKDLTLSDVHPQQQAVLLRRDVELTKAEFENLQAFRGSMAWDNIDDFQAELDKIGAAPMRPMAEIMAALDARFPLNAEADGVKSRAKNPGALPPPQSPVPTLSAADTPKNDAAMSPSSDAGPTPALDAAPAASPSAEEPSSAPAAASGDSVASLATPESAPSEAAGA